MPGSRINKGDIFDDSFFKALQDADKALKDVLATFSKMAKEAREISKGVQGAKTFDDLSKKAAAAGKSIKDLTAEEKRLERATKERAFQQSEAGKKLAVINQETQKARKENREYAKSQDAATKSTNRWGVAIKSFQFKFNALGNLIATATATVFRAFVRVVRNSVSIVQNFDTSTARLASVLGKSTDDIKKLTKEAKLLGSTTQFTADQVTGLQIELAKLGFLEGEISAATEGILSFATATKADLSDAAKVAGVAIRAFGLNALESEEAVATLAVATTKSALTFSDYETILSTLGPVAKAYGFTLEDTVALTGKLRDAGFDASKAATATRNILLNLADANGDLAKSLGGNVTNFDDLIDGMITLDQRGVSLAQTLQLTDKRSVAAFNQFLKTAEGARTLKGDITGVTGELQKMVDVQLDTLAGDIDLLKSAWEGLILALSDGGILREAVQLLTNAVLQISNLDLATTKFHKQNQEQLTRSFNLLGNLTNRQGEQFKAVVEELDQISFDELGADPNAFAARFQEIRKVNKKESVALAQEYLNQRQQQHDEEIRLEQVKNERIQKEKEDAAKKALLPTEDEIKAREVLNKAYERTAELLAKIKPPDETVSVFNVLTGEYDISTIQDDLDQYIDSLFDFSDQRKQDEQEMTEFLKEQFKERSEYELEQERKNAEAIKEITDQKNAYKIDIANEGFNFLANVNAREIALIDDKLEKGVGNEKQLQEEKKKLQRRAAIIDKSQALFNIAINTAMGVTNAASKVVTIPLIPFIIGLGIAQAASVIATPIPQFEKGTESAPGGLAIAGEKGRELMIGPDGKIGLTPDSATLMDISKGTRILPADITTELLRYSAIASGISGDKDERIVLAVMQKIDASNNRLYRAIKDKPVASSVLTPAGILTSTYKGTAVIKKLHKYFS